MNFNKLVVYTAIFGDYDKLNDPVLDSKDIDYICFTDNVNLSSKVWQIELSRRFVYEDSIRSARLIKICPHRFLAEYDYSLWIDGNMILQAIPDIEELLQGKTIALMKHPNRDCVYAEGAVCQDIPKDNQRIIEKQLKAYRKRRYPKSVGLYATGIIARKHKDKTLMPLSEKWWKHIETFSHRDQLSFPIVFKGYPINCLPKEMLNVWGNSENPFAKLREHNANH